MVEDAGEITAVALRMNYLVYGIVLGFGLVLAGQSHAELLAFTAPITPPAGYLAIGQQRQAAKQITVQQEPIEVVDALCREANDYQGTSTITACSFYYPNTDHYLVIIIDPVYVSPAFYIATFNHELGHVGGWPAEHPL